MEDSEQYTRVQQSLVSLATDTDVALEPGSEKSTLSWLLSPFSGYYSQLAWGKLCSFIQPQVNHHFSGSEIVPGLWISDHASVCDLQALRDRDIKHIVCAVLGVKAMFPKDFQYLRLPLRDTRDEDIYQFFELAADTIHQALENQEPVLVHCRCGVSRSVSLVCAYFIKYRGMNDVEAIRAVQKRRACANPNQSFRNQLRSFAETHHRIF